MIRYMVYPVFYREGYGFQQDNAEGTDGVPIYYVLYEERLDGGEGRNIVSFGPSMIQEMLQVADFFNAIDPNEFTDAIKVGMLFPTNVEEEE